MTLCDVCGRSVIGPRCGGTDDRVFWCTLDPGHEGSHESEDISYLCHTRGVDDCYHLGYERVRAEAEGLRRERDDLKALADKVMNERDAAEDKAKFERERANEWLAQKHDAEKRADAAEARASTTDRLLIAYRERIKTLEVALAESRKLGLQENTELGEARARLYALEDANHGLRDRVARLVKIKNAAAGVAVIWRDLTSQEMYGESISAALPPDELAEMNRHVENLRTAVRELPDATDRTERA